MSFVSYQLEVDYVFVILVKKIMFAKINVCGHTYTLVARRGCPNV